MALSCSRQSQTQRSYLQLFEVAICYTVHRSGKNKHRELWNLISFTSTGNKSEALISNQLPKVQVCLDSEWMIPIFIIHLEDCMWRELNLFSVCGSHIEYNLHNLF